MKVLVTGGARSGKSGFAERYAAAIGREGVYVATSQPFDEEMRERLALHRKQRESSGFAWTTVEEPLQLADVLSRIGDGVAGASSADDRRRVMLVDCLTLWLSNVLLRHEQAADVATVLRDEIERLCESVRAYEGDLILVTNEVGDGIVPAYKLGRVFRDWAGVLNRRIAALCDEVFLVTAGIPVELKRLAFRMDGVWPVEESNPGGHCGSEGESS